MKKMKVFSGILSTVVAVLLFISCENLIEGPEDEPQDVNGMATQATLTSIQKTVFNINCATTGCHNGTNAPNLLEGESYGSLVNVPSLEQPSLLRVKPGDSGGSLLIRKLTAIGTTRMPPVPRPALSQATIDSISAWIDRGAPDN